MVNPVTFSYEHIKDIHIKTITIKECPLLTNPEFNKVNKIRPIDREAYNIAYYAIQLWTK